MNPFIQRKNNVFTASIDSANIVLYSLCFDTGMHASIKGNAPSYSDAYRHLLHINVPNEAITITYHSYNKLQQDGLLAKLIRKGAFSKEA